MSNCIQGLLISNQRFGLGRAVKISIGTEYHGWLFGCGPNGWIPLRHATDEEFLSALALRCVRVFNP